MKQKHIVLTVFGSLGDLHPMLALALGLQAHGHKVTIAASRFYQAKIESEGINFAKMAPEQIYQEPGVFNALFDMRKGPELLMRKYLLPYVRDAFNDLSPVMEGADVLVNATSCYAGPLVAGHLKKPWASVLLQPFGYFSATDPSVIPVLPMAEKWTGLGTAFWKLLLSFADYQSHRWPDQVYAIQKELGLPYRGNPIFKGQFSPYLNLAMFSGHFAKPQPDWPGHTETTGFLFYDRRTPDEKGLPEEVKAFLDAGDPPIVFTLGSAVAMTNTEFYEISLRAVKQLNCRAVFVAGSRQPIHALPDNILWWDALPYSALFPYARAVVHQGGIGTTAQVLRAGKPMLVVPHGFDQPDNASRLKRLNVARVLYPGQYRENAVVRELSALLENPAYAERSMALAKLIQQEDGLGQACDRIETLF